MKALMDERSEPALRTVLGEMLTECSCADIAVANVRMTALDLAETELAGIRRCRILLGRLDARALDGGAAGSPAELRRARILAEFVASDRVEIRNSGVASWTPDFSLFRSLDGTARCLVGAHYFHDPVAAGGPSLTCMLADPVSVDLAGQRFEEVWQSAYDVRDAVIASVRTWLAEVSDALRTRPPG